jgi:hypothetical protein
VTPEQVGRLYGVELVDYGEHRGRGVLVAVGAGLMMAVMDGAPSLRWAVDTGTLRGRKATRLDEFLVAVEHAAKPVALAAWFSITDPTPIRLALERMKAPVVYTGGTPIGFPGECDELGAFFARLRA